MSMKYMVDLFRGVFLKLAIALSLLAVAAVSLQAQGSGTPILVITSNATFSNYYAEILRTEGLNQFTVADLASVNAAVLANYDVAILSRSALTTAQVTMFSDWVNAGGNLIAMRPDSKLGGLLGITSLGTTLTEAYLAVNTASAPGNGIVAQPMQFHGVADRYSLNGATAVATLYSNYLTPTTNPAVTMRSVGSNGGHAAAFLYDLATSIVYTRQGNPAWANQDRDGLPPKRSNDQFYGAAAGDIQPDWVDLANLASIPQADEQQRLLANLIHHLHLDRGPLPRFWYFPFGKKAVMLMTGDDHANGGTAGRFDLELAASPAGCNVDNWECVRSTSYLFALPGNMTSLQADAYTAQGFEVGVHINTGCSDFTEQSLSTTYTQQIADFQALYPNIPAPVSQRHHCIVWSDWASGARVESANGIRLDTNYYYWPGTWVQGRPGHFTGSAMPMRFADLDGSVIDVYNAVTQMTDESDQAYPYTSDALLSAAVGPQGFYGVYTVNAHTDTASSPVWVGAVSSAQARDVPIVSAAQLLRWLDGRNGSSFSGLSWDGSVLSFVVTQAPDARGLQVMVPVSSGAGELAGISGPGGVVPFTIDIVKGVSYAFFYASPGSFTATYGSDVVPPSVVSTSPANGATDVLLSEPVVANFSEPLDANTITPSSFVLRDSSNNVIPATVAYSAPDNRATLTPVASLAGSTTYTATISTAVTDLSGLAMASSHVWSFTTEAPPACPCTSWEPADVPANPSVNDPSAVELGVKFRSDLSGYIKGIRFYKGAGNTGTHIGSLWTSNGQILASAVFTNETATGWQQVNFSAPVAIAANTVYVASYHTTSGNYAADSNYFASTGINAAPIHLLQSGTSGLNGVYAYSANSTFPTESFNASNYWVDVVFDLSDAPLPLAVISTEPANSAAQVSVYSTISATLDRPLNGATVGSATFQVKGANGIAITGSYVTSGSTATVTPAEPLVAGETYTATITTGLKGSDGSSLALDYSWQFTTAGSTLACPCTGFSGSAVPSEPSAYDPNATEVGVKFRTSVNGYITGIRFYKGSLNTGIHTGNLWSSSGQLLASATFTNETATGWQQVDFSTPVLVTANTVYVASYHTTSGYYAADSYYFSSSGVDNPPVHLLGDGVNGGNGVYAYSATSTFPVSTFQSSNYWVDVVFNTTVGPSPLGVTGTDPANNASNLSIFTPVSAIFNNALNAATVTASTFQLRDPADALVPATYNVSGNTATLTPNAALTPFTPYTVTITTSLEDTNGGSLANAYSWTFTTAPPPCVTDCSIWPATSVPRNVDEGPDSPVQLGVRFRALADGTISGVRFYKAAANTGTHVGSLWTESGQLLASATFTGESASGWQQVNFSTPVPVTANTVYVASYHTTVGHYSGNSDYFATAGLINPPLEAMQNGISGFNGVFAYGGPGVFPAQGFNSTNYWVDVVYSSAPTSIVITPASATLPTGGTQQFVATATYADNSTRNVTSQVGWSSSALSVASINASGVATAVSGGSANITATQLGISGNAALTVADSLAITTAALPDAVPGIPYSATLAATGGAAPYSWSVTAGTLPSGLALNAASGTITGTPAAQGTSDITIQVSDSSSPAVSVTRALSIMVGQPAATDTGFLPPTAHQAVTSGAGDNNGFESNPANAYVVDGAVASDINSGTNTNTSCTDTGKDKHIFRDFGINIPAGISIHGIEVQLTSRADSASGSPKMCVDLSWNGGTDWTAAKSTPTLQTSLSALLLGSAADTWGRTWSDANFTNASFRVRVTNVASSTARDFYLDGISVRVSYGGGAAPEVTAFAIPSTSGSLTVPVTTFTATDDVEVTGYLLTETTATPSASASGWVTPAPASYTFATPGAKTLYAWAKDAEGNVSASRSASVTISIGDVTPPNVTAFTIPATSNSLTIPVSGFTATDDIAVTGYLLTESPVAPAASATSWSATPPISYTFVGGGGKTLYAWAKDAAGNVSTSLSANITITVATAGPEPLGWFAGDMHVHRSCGGTPEALLSILDRMEPENLSVISLLADSGSGEVQNATADLALVNGQDSPVSVPGRIVHWDAEWHWDPIYLQYDHLVLGGHVVTLGLTSAQQTRDEYTYPVLNRTRQQGGVGGFAHMQYLDGGIPQSLTCCTPIEYPVEVALGAADFISEDVDDANSGISMNPDAFIQAYYKLLNTGFRPGFAAGTDYPCNSNRPLGSLLTYVNVGGNPMTYGNWIQGIKNGRTVVSRNGHREFLEIVVNGSAGPGDEIQLAAGTSLPVSVRWTATQSYSGPLELVQNGVVVASIQANVKAGTPYVWNTTVSFDGSGWIAARRMGADGHQVHTAALFVIVNGAPIRASQSDAQFYVTWMDNLIAKTSPGGPWNQYFPTNLAAAQARYQAAKAVFEQRAAEAAPPPTPPAEGQTIFTTQTPNLPENDAPYELGTRFYANVNGQITGVRIYATAQEGGSHTVRIWNASTGTVVAGPFTWDFSSGTEGWKTFTLPTALSITANTDYVVSVSNSGDRWYAQAVQGFASPIVNGNLNTYVGSGVYSVTLGTMPASSWQNTNYFRDVVFEPQQP